MPSASLPGTLTLTLVGDPVLGTVMDTFPSTELAVLVTDADGNTKTLDSYAADPTDVARDIQFGTQLGSGFYTGGFSLSNPIDRDRDDLHLRDDVKFVGSSGDVAYEGFIAAMPRSVDTAHTLTVTAAGYIADTAQQSFRMVFIDRDLSGWGGEISIAQRIALIAIGYNPDGGSLVTAPDATGRPGLVSSRPGVLNKPINRYVYDAGPGNTISRLYVGTQTLGTLTTGDASLEVNAVFWNDLDAADQVISGNVRTLTTLDLDVSATPRRYAVMHWLHNSTAFGTAGIDYSVRWQDVCVIGDHGLSTLDVGSVPQGVSASDVISYLVGRYCPKINTAGVQVTTYPIAQLAWKDRATVYDALLKVNSYHLWGLAVWEDRTLHYAQISLDDWDWEVRHDDIRPTQIGLQGDSVENLRNGIIVSFTNAATGATEELHPDDYAELRDDSIDNPLNQHGDKQYGDPFTIPYPTTRGNALELGRIKLLEDLQVKAPGSFTVSWHIRDRAGVWQPVWKVRAGDRVRLTSSASLSDRPRLIHETSYSHEGRSLTISVDSTLRVIDALLDRTTTALQAHGLLQ